MFIKWRTCVSNERVPLYMQIQEHYKQLITSGELQPDDRIPPEKELLAHFGVSRITVANALSELAKEGWIYRIPGRGSFVNGVPEAQRAASAAGAPEQAANLAAAAPLAHERRMIGLVFPALPDYFAIRLINGLHRVMNDNNYWVSIVLTGNSIQREKEAIRNFIQMGAQGLIIFPVDAQTYNEEILALKVSGFPFVLIDRFLPGVETHFVATDSRRGAKLAVDHLWELGHRKIAICSDSPLPTMTVSDRIAGYMEALKNKNALIDPSLILTDFQIDYNTIDEDHPLYRHVKNQFATAFITLNALLGKYIESIARQIGLRTPEDISIITFDNPDESFDNQTGFTHVNQHEARIGEESGKVLIDLIENRDRKSGYRKIVLEPELEVRKTSGRCTESDSEVKVK
ncbi:GntR family transcriptional regulator [Paenibacillaceae bacterium]|nr:GntR family transcriptional regulator [Paenibacillaceae bacterium]